MREGQRLSMVHTPIISRQSRGVYGCCSPTLSICCYSGCVVDGGKRLVFLFIGSQKQKYTVQYEEQENWFYLVIHKVRQQNYIAFETLKNKSSNKHTV